MSKKLKELHGELDVLVRQGRDLALATLVQYRPKEVIGKISKEYSEKLSKIIVMHEYQIWYSSALVVVKQLLPSRLNDFIGFYEYPQKRASLTMMNFRVADAIRGHSLAKQNEWNENVEMAGWSTCYPLIEAQCNILESATSYFTTSLHEIQQVVQADLFDSEIDAARELNKKGFARAAGAMAGVVLEKHFDSVINSHSLAMSKKNPCINDYNQKLKDEGLIDIPTWRFIQRLGDLRNLCDHAKGVEPSKGDIGELIAGVDKIMKTVA